MSSNARAPQNTAPLAPISCRPDWKVVNFPTIAAVRTHIVLSISFSQRQRWQGLAGCRTVSVSLNSATFELYLQVAMQLPCQRMQEVL
jgi:hypothetical protein